MLSAVGTNFFLFWSKSKWNYFVGEPNNWKSSKEAKRGESDDGDALND
jgi:hypothetical protein